MQSRILLFIVYLIVPAVFGDDVSYQACVDKYSRKGYQPWQEWSDHYTCHRYRCEIRDGKYFIAAVGCRKPKIPENALECHEYIEDENVEFPTCCARLRCVVEVNGERIVQTRGQPGELFPDKPWKGQTNEPNPAVVGIAGMPQNSAAEAPVPPNAGIFNSGRNSADGNNDISNRRFVDPYPGQPIQESPRKKRSTSHPLFNKETRESPAYQGIEPKVYGYMPEKYTSYFTNTIKELVNNNFH